MLSVLAPVVKVRNPFHPSWGRTTSGITSGWSNGGFYPDGDPLWDGEGCGSGSTCCELNGPPYFCKSLTESTADDIEVRICSDENLSLADTSIQLIEIFVQ